MNKVVTGLASSNFPHLQKLNCGGKLFVVFICCVHELQSPRLKLEIHKLARKSQRII